MSKKIVKVTEKQDGIAVMHVYECLAKDIRDYGVTEVFGLVSDDTVMLATALDSLGIIFNGARHENTAIAMAEGYSAASGNLGIAVIGRGPAAANGYTRSSL